MHRLLSRATLLLTDSGGLQEEAVYLGLPTLVLRECTERPEGVRAGVLRSIGCQRETVRAAVAQLLTDERARLSMARPSTVFGDGFAAERIVHALQEKIDALV
jgi:UDP-N-acetylglucosamine 2-epimerase (non-hydrolysing)